MSAERKEELPYESSDVIPDTVLFLFSGEFPQSYSSEYLDNALDLVNLQSFSNFVSIYRYLEDSLPEDSHIELIYDSVDPVYLAYEHDKEKEYEDYVEPVKHIDEHHGSFTLLFTQVDNRMKQNLAVKHSMFSQFNKTTKPIEFTYRKHYQQMFEDIDFGDKQYNFIFLGGGYTEFFTDENMIKLKNLLDRNGMIINLAIPYRTTPDFDIVNSALPTYFTSEKLEDMKRPGKLNRPFYSSSGEPICAYKHKPVPQTGSGYGSHQIVPKYRFY